MAKHNQYCLGTAETQVKEKVSSGVVTWSEVCLAITTLMLLCSVVFRWRLLLYLWTLKGIMPQNLPEQIMQRIVRLSADGNSQWEVASNWETGRPHQRKRGGSMKISMPWEGRQLLRIFRMNRIISTPHLRMQMIRRLGRRMSVRTIWRRLLAAVYWSRHPARCPRLTLEHRRLHC